MKNLFLDSQFVAETRPSNHIDYLTLLKNNNYSANKIIDTNSDIAILVLKDNDNSSNYYIRNIKSEENTNN